MFNDQTILITGGTGSFGNGFVKRILTDYKPKKIIIYSRDEFKQFEMQKIFNQKCMRYFLGDVRDSERLKIAMRDVDYVVHAAALKQVPAAEYNPMEFIKTNIHGAENIIKSSIENNVRRIIALSTDKASNPINLYGATKLCSDKLFVAANNIVGRQDTQFSIVRYGNVVSTRGSVVPEFQRLAKEGSEYLPITNKKMTRFWITLDQGINFVLKSFYRMQGGEIFVPKLPSVHITDVAKAIAPKLKQKVIGTRPGEKLHETMCSTNESNYIYEFKDHYVIGPTINYSHKIDYTNNKLDENGKHLSEEFIYNSGTNKDFLTIEEIVKYK